MYDEIYWTFLDEKYFGKPGSLEDRIELLNDEEKSELNTIF